MSPNLNPSRLATLAQIDAEVARIGDPIIAGKIARALNDEDPDDARLGRWLADLRGRPTTRRVPWELLRLFMMQIYLVLVVEWGRARDRLAAVGFEPATVDNVLPPLAPDVVGESTQEPCDDPALVAEVEEDERDVVAPARLGAELVTGRVLAPVERWEPMYRVGGTRYGRSQADQAVWARCRAAGVLALNGDKAECVYSPPSTNVETPTTKVYSVSMQYLRPRQGAVVLRYAVTGDAPAALLPSAPAPAAAVEIRPEPVVVGDIVNGAPAPDLSLDAALERTRAREARQARIAAVTAQALASGAQEPAQAQAAQSVTDAAGRNEGRLLDETLIAGVGDGSSLGWDGRGECTRGVLAEILVDADLPANLLPGVRSPERVLQTIVAGLANGGRTQGKVPQAKASTIVAQWRVGRVASEGGAGESFGDTILLVTLADDQGTLRVEGDTALCARVRSEYARITAEQAYPAGEVTAWIQGILRSRWGAVHLIGDGGWYIRPQFRAQVEALHHAFRYGGAGGKCRWGRWSRQVGRRGNTADLRANLAGGLVEEIEAVLGAIAVSRAAVDKRGGTSISSTVAATHLAALKVVLGKAKALNDVLDAANLAEVQAAAVAAAAVLATEADDTSLRGALLDMSGTAQAVKPARKGGY